MASEIRLAARLFVGGCCSRRRRAAAIAPSRLADGEGARIWQSPKLASLDEFWPSPIEGAQSFWIRREISGTRAAKLGKSSYFLGLAR